MINPPFYRLLGSRYNAAQLGIGYITSTLRHNGHEAWTFNADYVSEKSYQNLQGIFDGYHDYKKYFEKDYPKGVDGYNVGSIEEVYEKAFNTATEIKKEEHQLELADAQFVGFKEGKWSNIIGLVESMGLTKKEWQNWKKKFPQILDGDDIKEVNDYFKTKDNE